jgi:hypothetical protein
MCDDEYSELYDDPNSPRIFKCDYVQIEVDENDSSESSVSADDTSNIASFPKDEELLSLLVPVPNTKDGVELPCLSDDELEEMKPLLDKISSILFECDPACINFVTNTDEYDPEADIIVAMLHDCGSLDEAMDAIIRTVHEMICTDISAYKRNRKVVNMSKRIWSAWCNNQLEVEN